MQYRRHTDTQVYIVGKTVELTCGQIGCLDTCIANFLSTASYLLSLSLYVWTLDLLMCKLPLSSLLLHSHWDAWNKVETSSNACYQDVLCSTLMWHSERRNHQSELNNDRCSQPKSHLSASFFSIPICQQFLFYTRFIKKVVSIFFPIPICQQFLFHTRSIKKVRNGDFCIRHCQWVIWYTLLTTNLQNLKCRVAYSFKRAHVLYKSYVRVQVVKQNES